MHLFDMKTVNKELTSLLVKFPNFCFGYPMQLTVIEQLRFKLEDSTKENNNKKTKVRNLNEHDQRRGKLSKL